jgi:hypothetical protein
MFRRVQTALLAIGLHALVASCTDSIPPDLPTPPVHVAELIARSPTSLIGIVGTLATDPPSVLARDASGHPLPGVEVKFTPSAGYLSSPSVITNAAGIATVDSWSISPVAGKIIVTAMSGGATPVVFTMTALPGPAAKIVKLEGDNNVGRAGAPVRPAPRVRVTDQFDNGVPSTTVKFSVAAGGGNIVGSEVVTDSLGFATVGEWILGPAGDQLLDAEVNALAPARFVAKVGTIPDFPCLAVFDLYAGSAVTSELDGLTCMSADGRGFESYLLRPVAERATQVTLESTDFDTFLEIRDSKGELVASNDNRADKVSNSAIKAILPAGDFVAVATTAHKNEGGRYTVRYDLVDPSPDCADLFLTRGVSIYQRMVFKKCADDRPYWVDRYKIYLRAGVPVSIQVDDKSYDGPTVMLMDDKGATAASQVVEDFYRHIIKFTAPADGYYTLQITADGELIEYTLDVK